MVTRSGAAGEGSSRNGLATRRSARTRSRGSAGQEAKEKVKPSATKFVIKLGGTKDVSKDAHKDERKKKLPKVTVRGASPQPTSGPAPLKQSKFYLEVPEPGTKRSRKSSFANRNDMVVTPLKRGSQLSMGKRATESTPISISGRSRSRSHDKSSPKKERTRSRSAPKQVPITESSPKKIEVRIRRRSEQSPGKSSELSSGKSSEPSPAKPLHQSPENVSDESPTRASATKLVRPRKRKRRESGADNGTTEGRAESSGSTPRNAKRARSDADPKGDGKEQQEAQKKRRGRGPGRMSPQKAAFTIVKRLVKWDDQQSFYEPVPVSLAPDYYDVIKKPICLKEMKERAEARQYEIYEDVVVDIELLFLNCMIYNPEGNIYHNQAAKLLRKVRMEIQTYAQKLYDQNIPEDLIGDWRNAVNVAKDLQQGKPDPRAPAREARRKQKEAELEAKKLQQEAKRKEKEERARLEYERLLEKERQKELKEKAAIEAKSSLTSEQQELAVAAAPYVAPEEVSVQSSIPVEHASYIGEPAAVPQGYLLEAELRDASEKLKRRFPYPPRASEQYVKMEGTITPEELLDLPKPHVDYVGFMIGDSSIDWDSSKTAANYHVTYPREHLMDQILRSRRTPLKRRRSHLFGSEQRDHRSAPAALTQLLARISSSDDSNSPLVSASADLRAAQSVIGVIVDSEDDDNTSGTIPLEKVFTELQKSQHDVEFLRGVVAKQQSLIQSMVAEANHRNEGDVDPMAESEDEFQDEPEKRSRISVVFGGTDLRDSGNESDVSEDAGPSTAPVDGDDPVTRMIKQNSRAIVQLQRRQLERYNSQNTAWDHLAKKDHALLERNLEVLVALARPRDFAKEATAQKAFQDVAKRIEQWTTMNPVTQ